MTEINRLMPKRLSLGDAAVDGLLNGVLAGMAMAVFLAVAGLLSGDAPLGVLGRFDPSARPQALTGLLMHLAVAGVYGTLFGIVWRQIAGRAHQGAAALLIGLVYGSALLIFAQTIVLPGSHFALLAIPTWHFAMAHLVYGLTLGWLMSRAGT